MFSEAKLKKFLNTRQKRLHFFQCGMLGYCKYPPMGSTVLVFVLSTHPLISPSTHLRWSNYLHLSTAAISWELHLSINQAIILSIHLFNLVWAFIYLSAHPHVSPSLKCRWVFISHFKYGPNITLGKIRILNRVCVCTLIHKITPVWSTKDCKETSYNLWMARW